MDTVVFVSPTLYSAGFHDRWESPVAKPGYIPILKSDVPKFEQSLKPLTARGTSAEQKGEVSNLQPNGNAGNNVIEARNSASRYVQLQAFLPISLDQQLHTVCVSHLPAGLSVNSIDRIVDKLDQLLQDWLDEKDSQKHYIKQWSFVDCVDSLTIYLSFFDELKQQYGDACRFLDQLFQKENGQLHMDENTSLYVADLQKKLVPREIEERTREEFSVLLDMLKNESMSSGDRNVNSSSVEYEVDVSTLSDLPSSALTQICKDIVEFRTRVITLEKEKREKELLEEHKRRRQHLKNMFERIKNTTGSSAPTDVSKEDGDDEDDEDDEDDDDEYQEMDDYEFEQRRLKSEREAQETAYAALVRDFEDTTLLEYASLRQEYRHLANYEQHLVKNRGSLLKELEHLAADPHYDHHRSYKDSELKADAEDRLAHPEPEPQELETKPELNTTPYMAESEPKIKLALKHKSQKDRVHSDEPVQTHASLPQKLVKLRESAAVDELVKEYLGVYEPELVDFIFEHVAEHQSQEALQAELAETFDEDSPVLVSRIWQALEAL